MIIEINSDLKGKLLRIHKAGIDCVRLTILEVDKTQDAITGSRCIEVNKKELLDAIKALQN